ncbi:MAG: hypothetical protein V3S00_06110 [Dehalococcoidia bacterium]
MDILDLIDRLEQLAGDARRLPVGGGLVVSRQRLLDLVDRMRVAVPHEVYDAREVLERRDELLTAAQEEAGRLLAQVQAEVEERITETEIMKAAEERGREVLLQAERRAQELAKEAEGQAMARLDDAQEVSRAQMREADVYALQTLKRLQQELEEFLVKVQRGAETLEQRAMDRPG